VLQIVAMEDVATPASVELGDDGRLLGRPKIERVLPAQVIRTRAADAAG
jgi:hypothetical protein